MVTMGSTTRSTMRSTTRKIRLKPKHDRRFRSGHPWVYSNELQESPQGIERGEPLELLDPSGKFLAWGYANPSSLIAFRTVSRDEAETDALGPNGVARRLEKAWQLRQALGFSGVSHRLCFGEADRLPGFIADLYVSSQGGSTLVVQAQTAGADRWTQQWSEVLRSWRGLHRGGSLDFERLSVIIKNDSSARIREGLAQEPGRWLEQRSGAEAQTSILIRSADGRNPSPLEFSVDLISGQKTGFFLDQWANIQLTLTRLEDWARITGRQSVRVLDLCCYVGQWSTQLSRFFQARGIATEITLVDASRSALEGAAKNAERAGASSVQRLEADVLRDLGSLADRSFDCVISDPPALIKGRKDLPTGTHAYLQLHTQAARVLAEQGVWVACSCSGLLTEEAFGETLAKAARRGGRQVSWIARGGQSPDHPVLAEFPEGRYLKSWIGMSL
jgi:23S rRNA (cytosine1962-C5)-methyltransferase